MIGRNILTPLMRYRQSLIALGFWLSLIGVAVPYLRANELSLVGGLQQLTDQIQDVWYGPIIYIVLYALRPLTFFSSTITSILAGSLFGPIGLLWAVIGSNLSAGLTYFIGRFFGADVAQSRSGLGILEPYAQRLRRSSFETIMVLRLIYAPYDLVGYLAGFLRIGWRGFLVATALSALPGTTSLVLFGTTLPADQVLAGEIPPFSPWLLLASLFLFLLGITISRFMRQREGRQILEDTGQPMADS